MYSLAVVNKGRGTPNTAHPRSRTSATLVFLSVCESLPFGCFRLIRTIVTAKGTWNLPQRRVAGSTAHGEIQSPHEKSSSEIGSPGLKIAGTMTLPIYLVRPKGHLPDSAARGYRRPGGWGKRCSDRGDSSRIGQAVQKMCELSELCELSEITPSPFRTAEADGNF
jgi:hypothetical protein